MQAAIFPLILVLNVALVPAFKRVAWLPHNRSSAGLESQQGGTAPQKNTISVKERGARGDGVSDDSAALEQVFNSVSEGSTIYFPPGVYRYRVKLVLKAPHVTLKGDQATLAELSGHWGTGTTVAIQIAGAGDAISGMNFDGRQYDFQSPGEGAAYLVDVTAPSFSIQNCIFKNGVGLGLEIDGSNGTIRNIRSEHNVGLGLQTVGAHDLEFSDAVFEENGCGFHLSHPNCPRRAFGVALRFRSHHISFRNCQAIMNGADGFNVNQGSYDIRFSDCVARGNGDGGFTTAADSSAPGHPGDRENPHDLRYIKCVSFENYASGVAAYAPTDNLEIITGKFYDNGMGQGLTPDSSSLADGIFIAGNSHNVRIIGVQTYDDRQSSVVTRVNGNQIQLAQTRWKTGMRSQYPRVLVVRKSAQIVGRANLEDEQESKVTLAPTKVQGIGAGAIAPGDVVTQRTQRWGVFLSDGVTGTYEGESWGNVQGSTYRGRTTNVEVRERVRQVR